MDALPEIDEVGKLQRKAEDEDTGSGDPSDIDEDMLNNGRPVGVRNLNSTRTLIGNGIASDLQRNVKSSMHDFGITRRRKRLKHRRQLRRFPCVT